MDCLLLPVSGDAWAGLIIFDRYPMTTALLSYQSLEVPEEYDIPKNLEKPGVLDTKSCENFTN